MAGGIAFGSFSQEPRALPAWRERQLVERLGFPTLEKATIYEDACLLGLHDVTGAGDFAVCGAQGSDLHKEGSIEVCESQFAALYFQVIKSGESSDFVVRHVRAGQEVFEAEVASAGFEKIGEVKGVLKENYFVRFRKK